MSRLKTGSRKSSTKHPKPFSHKNYLFKFRRTEKISIFCFHLSHRKFQYLIFLHSHQTSLETFFLHNGYSALQSVNCKPVSEQRINMTLSTKMFGQNLITSLRFYALKNDIGDDLFSHKYSRQIWSKFSILNRLDAFETKYNTTYTRNKTSYEPGTKTSHSCEV